MIKLLYTAIIVLFAASAQASGPVLPDNYRLPSENELAAEWRSKDAEKYASVAADFNGDGLVDGCFLAIDKKRGKLVLLVVLIDKGSNSDKWYVLDALSYEAIRFMGVASVEPSTVMVYPSQEGSRKIAKKVYNHSIKFFASEGASSLFHWDRKAKRFKRLWLTK